MLPHTLIPVIASTYCEKYAVPFFLGHPAYAEWAGGHAPMSEVDNGHLRTIHDGFALECPLTLQH